MKVFIREPKDRYVDNYKGIDFANKYGEKLDIKDVKKYLKKFISKYFNTECVKILDITFEYGNTIQFTYLIKNSDRKIGRPFGGTFDPESFNNLLESIIKIIDKYERK